MRSISVRIRLPVQSWAPHSLISPVRRVAPQRALRPSMPKCRDGLRRSERPELERMMQRQGRGHRGDVMFWSVAERASVTIRMWMPTFGSNHPRHSSAKCMEQSYNHHGRTRSAQHAVDGRCRTGFPPTLHFPNNSPIRTMDAQEEPVDTWVKDVLRTKGTSMKIPTFSAPSRRRRCTTASPACQSAISDPSS